jgi:hypothetical protein
VPTPCVTDEALLDRSERFFGLETLGKDMQGSAKLFAADREQGRDNQIDSFTMHPCDPRHGGDACSHG